jgi:phage antirepressor YoqD-like protein
MASRAVVVIVDSPEDRTKILDLAREVAKQLMPWSSQRAVVLIYGQEIRSCAPKSAEFDNLVKRRGAVWVGNYKGPLASVIKITEDLESAMRDWRGEAHRG